VRVIAGKRKGRRLKAPDGLTIRPTADRVKEALFSILGGEVEGARVLDLYAGSGALGIEALSRGAAHVTFVEADPLSIRLIRENLQVCGLTDSVEVHVRRVETFLSRVPVTVPPFRIVLADPPYRATEEVIRLAAQFPTRLLEPHGIVALEHGEGFVPPPAFGPLTRSRTYRYGETAVTLYRLETAPSIASPESA
jgi:16S rRNA (guanine(966)-N(2))-methyltransferase RsmD